MCAEGGPLNKDRYFVRELELLGRTLRIYQECLSDVGGVVWDSAIVASHYFAREKDYWKNKQVGSYLFYAWNERRCCGFHSYRWTSDI